MKILKGSKSFNSLGSATFIGNIADLFSEIRYNLEQYKDNYVHTYTNSDVNNEMESEYRSLEYDISILSSNISKFIDTFGFNKDDLPEITVDEYNEYRNTPDAQFSEALSDRFAERKGWK